jgi:peptidoglycan/LPS O-acetylase OafA/YrhL
VSSLPRSDAITSLRFFAAAHVVAYHYARELSGLPQFVTSLLYAGPSSVGLFFVLSGFVLARRYDGGVRVRDYAVARIARIVPLYWLSLVLAAPILLVTPHPIAAVITVPTFLQAWVPQTTLAWNEPAWSLSVEMFFYAVFPALLPWAQRLRHPLRAAALVWVGTVLLLAAVMKVYPPARAAFALIPDDPLLVLLLFNPALMLPQFTFGVLLGVARLRLPTWWAAVGVVVLTVILGGLPLPRILMNGGALIPLFGLVIVAASGMQRGWLTARPLVAAGEASYGLYLLQVPVALWFAAAYAPAAQAFGTYFVVLLGASLLIHRGIEIPLRGAIRRAMTANVVSANDAVRTPARRERGVGTGAGTP